MTPEERRQKKNQESRESYNWYKAHHVCVRCNTAPAADGLVTCQACREAVNARHRFWYAGLTPEEKAERSAKKRQSERHGEPLGFAPDAAGSEKTRTF